VTEQPSRQPVGNPPPGAGDAAAAQAVGTLPRNAYTSWIRRVGAAVIDVIPVLVLGDIGSGVFHSSSTSGVGIGIGLVFGLAALGYAFLNWGYRQGITGSSVGKSLLRFKVVSEQTGQPLGVGPSVVRQITHTVDSMTCNIGFLFPLWDSKRQTLADKIMFTVCLPISRG